MKKSLNLRLQLLINFITSYLSSFISIGIQFVFIPFLIIGVGLSNYGIYTLFLFFSLTGGLSLFDFGLQGTVVKFLSGSIASNDNKKTTKYITESAILFLSLGIIFGLFVFIINFLFFRYLYNIDDVNNSFIFIFSSLAAINLFIDFINIFSAGIYEATLRKDLLDILNTSKIIFFALIVFLSFTFYDNSISIVLLISVITNVLFTLISTLFGYRLVKQYIIKKFEFNWVEIFSLLKQSRDLFISRFVGFLDNQFPRIIVSTLLPIQFLGIYDIILRIVGIVRTLAGKITQIGLIAFSSILQERNDREGLKYNFMNMTKISFLIIMPLLIVLFFYIESFLKIWLKSEYIEIENLIRLYLFQLLLTTFTTVGGIMLIGLHKVKIILKLSVTLFAITTLFSYITTHIWGINGLAINTTFFALIFIPLYLNKLLIEFEVSLKYFLKKVFMAHAFISFIFTLIFAILINLYTPKSLLEIVLIIGVTWMSYFLLFFIVGLNKKEKAVVFNFKTRVIIKLKNSYKNLT